MSIPIQLQDKDHALIEILKKELGLKTKTETVRAALEMQLVAIQKEKRREHFRKSIHEIYASSKDFMDEVKTQKGLQLKKFKYEDSK